MVLQKLITTGSLAYYCSKSHCCQALELLLLAYFLFLFFCFLVNFSLFLLMFISPSSFRRVLILNRASALVVHWFLLKVNKHVWFCVCMCVYTCVCMCVLWSFCLQWTWQFSVEWCRMGEGTVDNNIQTSCLQITLSWMILGVGDGGGYKKGKRQIM